MHIARLRVMAGLAGATLCLFAATASAQNPTTTTTDPNAQAAGAVTTQQPTTTPTDQATTPTTTTDQSTVSQTTTTEGTTTTRSFPGGTLGILAVAVLVLLVLFALFRGRDKTVIKENYVATPPVTGSRTVTTSTTTDDRMNLNSRAASGPGSNPSGGFNDPNARR
jgi:hypothetical protein